MIIDNLIWFLKILYGNLKRIFYKASVYDRIITT